MAPETNQTGIPSRARLLASARKLFAELGYESTSTASIARAAGTSESQLIKHFSGKAGLLDAIFASGWSQLGPAMEERLHRLETPADRLRAIPQFAFESLEKDPEWWQLLLLEGRRLRKEGANSTFTDGFRELEAIIDRILADMRVSGQLREGLNPRAIRAALMGVIENAMRDQILWTRSGRPAEFVPANVSAMVSVLVDSITNDGESHAA